MPPYITNTRRFACPTLKFLKTATKSVGVVVDARIPLLTPVVMLQVRSTTVNCDYYKKKTRELAVCLFDVKLTIAPVKLHWITRTG